MNAANTGLCEKIGPMSALPKKRQALARLTRGNRQFSAPGINTMRPHCLAPDNVSFRFLATAYNTVNVQRNARLKKLLADAMLDNAVLKDLLGKN